MKYLRRFMAVFMMAAVVFCKVPVSEVHADTLVEDGYSELNGLTITASTDKKSYKDGESAVITFEITNTNDYDLVDCSVEYIIPSNFKVDESELITDFVLIEAGETKTFSVNAVVSPDPNGEDVIVEEIPENNNAEENSGAGSAEENTGYSTSVYIVCGAAIIIIVIGLIVIITTLKGGRKTLSILLAVSMTGSMIYISPVSIAEAEPEGYTIEEKNFDRVSVHDPSIVKDPSTGTYYIFGSHLAFAKSDDLMSWTTFTNNINSDYNTLFEEPWSWAGAVTTSGTLSGMMWAPDVIWNDTMQKWCMYMSIDGDNWTSSICLLTADNIEGPYEYKGIVVYSGVNNPKAEVDAGKTDIFKVLGEDADLSRYRSTDYSCINAIDPNVQYDDEGNLYMTYGSWSAGIYQLKLDVNTGLRDYETTYETVKNVSDAYYGTKIAGGYYCSGEGPYILHTNGYYYLFLSYAGLEATGGYQMRIYRSENIAGPYVDQNGNSAIQTQYSDMKLTSKGAKIFGSYSMYGISRVQVAQGHNSAFVDDDGKIYLVYHTRFQSATGTDNGHQVRVHQLFVNDEGWLVAAPYEYTGETLSEEGYDISDIVGRYEVLIHIPTMYYNVVNGKTSGIIGGERTTARVAASKNIVVDGKQSKFTIRVSFTKSDADYIYLNEDGTITGSIEGKWEITSGSNVKITIGTVQYSGVFLLQADEMADREMMMTFSAMTRNMAMWGVKRITKE